MSCLLALTTLCTSGIVELPTYCIKHSTRKLYYEREIAPKTRKNINICVYVCIHKYKYICMYVYICANVYICVCMHMYHEIYKYIYNIYNIII